jgi:hypothetical protein
LWRATTKDGLQHNDPEAVARHHLRENARRVLADFAVLEVVAAQDAVNAVIGSWSATGAGLDVRGSAVLAVPPEDLDLAKEHLRTGRTGDLQRMETLRDITFLQQILADQDQRIVWWITHHPDRLEELASLNSQLAGLRPPSGLARDELRSQVIHFIDRMTAELHTPQQREMFIRALARALQVLGNSELQRTAEAWLTTTMPSVIKGEQEPV